MYINLKFQIFGSKSSQDYDVMVIVDHIHSTKECDDICHHYNSLLSEYLDSLNYKQKPLNCNLCMIEDGIITQTYKGTIDEVNNSMLLTYNNFDQLFPNQITRLVDRDIDLKLLRIYRIILSFLSRSNHRVLVKTAIRGSLLDKVLALQQIEFSDTFLFGSRNGDPINFYKNIAFQLGQIMGLLNGKEFYTKEDIANNYPLLSTTLFRDSINYDAINMYICDLNQLVLTQKSHLLNLNEKTYLK